MTREQALQQHLALCEELHALVLDENRFLKQHRRAPDAALLERKRGLLDRLDTCLKELKGHPPTTTEPPGNRDLSGRAQSRILQILHLDKENEQLLLHTSLRPKLEAPAPQAAPSRLNRLYGGGSSNSKS